MARKRSPGGFAVVNWYPDARVLRHNFPSEPVRWTTEQLLDSFREAALAGVEMVWWQLGLDVDRFTLWCHGVALDPLTEAAVASIRDPDTGFASLLNRSQDFWESSYEAQVEVGDSGFSLYLIYDLSGFETGEGTVWGLPPHGPGLQ